MMNVLIVENEKCLGRIWAEYIRGSGCCVTLVHTQSDAIEALSAREYGVVVLSMDMLDCSAMGVADYASYRRPNAKVIYVTRSGFFSDGSIFEFMSNACAMVPYGTPPSDLAALVAYHGDDVQYVKSA